MNPLFNLLKDSGTQAMLVLVGTISAIIAAIGTIYFGRKSLTKKDLRPLEDHTAATSGHLKAQNARTELNLRASRVSISVCGQDFDDRPFSLRLTLKDPAVTLTHVELYNETQSIFGFFPCEKLDELAFRATIDPQAMRKWFNGGTPVQSSDRMRLNLRVYMQLDGHEASRQMSVILLSFLKADMTQPNPTNKQAYMIEGDV